MNKKYTCDSCKYYSNDKYNYNKHIKTKKHLKNTNMWNILCNDIIDNIMSYITIYDLYNFSYVNKHFNNLFLLLINSNNFSFLYFRSLNFKKIKKYINYNIIKILLFQILMTFGK